MRLLWIGEQNEAPPVAEAVRTLAQTPSLTAIALEQEDRKTLDAVFLDCRNGCPYSMPHLLMTAARFRLLSIRLCVLANGKLFTQLKAKGEALFWVTNGNPAMALETLQRLHPLKSTEPIPEEDAHPEAVSEIPLVIPDGMLPVIHVVGSQARIGCTTQCLLLYHCFAALGFSPAVVTTLEQITLLAKRMGASVTADGCTCIEGIPFTPSMNCAHDCYIRDCGVIREEIATEAQESDLCVLVAGAKPWELHATAAALSLMGSARQMLTAFSFCEQDMTKPVQQLLERLHHSSSFLTVPWHPNPFVSNASYLELLRPALAQLFEQSDIALERTTSCK